MRAPIRLLHTADWQLGRRFGQFAPDSAAILADARFSTISQIHALAKEKSVDVTLVAGDIFDSNQLSDAEVLRGFNLICESPCPIVLLPGNHDADTPGSVWERILHMRALPAHVYIVRAGQAQALLLLDGQLAILTAPLAQIRAEIDHLSLFTAQRSAQTLSPDCTVIGLAHGSVTGKLPPGAELSNSIASSLASDAKLDYLALGDWHGYLAIDSKTFYSGTPEPDRFRANAKGQLLLVELAAEQEPQVSVHSVAQFDWIEMPLSAISSDSAASLMAQIASAIATQTGASTPEKLRQLVLRLKVSGTLGLAARFDFERALADLSATIRLLIVRDVGLRTAAAASSLAVLEAQFVGASYAQNVARALHAELADPDAAISRRASDALGRLHQLSQQG